MVNEKTVAGASYGGGLFAVLASLTLTEWGVIVGIITAILTFAFNVWYRHRAFRLEERECEQRMAIERREHELRIAEIDRRRRELAQ